MPFSLQQFLDCFKQYNQAVFPMQMVCYLLGIIAIYLAVKSTPTSDKVINSILAFLWGWMGIVYHLAFFSRINKAAILFGAVFLIQGLLFLILGVFSSKLSYRFRADRFGIAGIILIGYALVVYPIIGYALGHIYPYAPTFGLPCPTTIFTFGMLLFIYKKCPAAILIIPFLWSLIGFTAALQFGILEDTGLLVAGVLAVIMLWQRNKQLT